MLNQNQDIDELISLIFGILQAVHERLRAAEPGCVSPLRIETLRYIKEKKSPLMKEVADFLSIRPPSATSLIGGLAKEGLIERVTDSRDRRAVRLAITPKGRLVLGKSIAFITNSMKEVFSSLGTRERKQLVRIYRKLIKIINKSPCLISGSGIKNK